MVNCGDAEEQKNRGNEAIDKRNPSAKPAKLTPAQTANKTLRKLKRNGDRIGFVREIRHANGDFSYLEARIEKPTGKSTKLAISKSGNPRTRSGARTAFLREHRRRWGTITPDAARTLHNLQPHRTVQLFGRLRETAKVTLKHLKNQLPTSTKLLTVTPRTNSKSLDSFEVKATKADGKAVGKLSSVAWINTVPQKVYLGGESGSADYTETDTQYNDAGEFAEGVKIGISDDLYNGCIMNTDHVAFNDATITYTQTPLPCDSNADCPSDCSADTTTTVAGTCTTIDSPDRVTNIPSSDSYCIYESHAQWVSSRITQSHSTGKPRHAAEAHLIVANETNLNHWASASAYEGVLALLVDTFDARIINESWGMDINDQSYDTYHQIRDEWARNENVVFSKIAHNQGTADPSSSGCLLDESGSPSDEFVACHSQNTICVGGTSASGTYDDLTDDTMYCGSRWRNPDSFEIEEPDLVSQGQNAKIMKDSTTDQWNHNAYGTSFAAPTVAGLIALFEGACGASDELRIRSITRTSAWRWQSLEKPGNPFYPTFPPGIDSYAGAGILEASTLHDFCDDGSDPAAGNSEDGSWNGSNMTTPPSWMVTGNPEAENDSNLTTAALKLSNPIASELFNYGNLTGGTYVRATASWNNCPGDGSRVSPIDYDIALCGERDSDGVKKCFSYAQSMHDVNEGFDTMVPEDFNNVRLMIFSEDGESGCGGEDERVWWSTWWL